MAYRKFWLENSLGAKYHLADRASAIFFYEPDGLGFSKEIETERVGNQETVISELIDMPTVSGELLFYKDTTSNKYQEYYNFIQFIKYKPLKLHYLPPNTQEDYVCNVVMTKLDKSEVSSDDNVLHCATEIRCLTHWQTSQTRTIVVTADASDDSKDYPLAYPYGYGAGSLNNIELRNEGTEAVGMVIEITGEAVNPQIALFDENNNEYGLLKLSGTFDYVRINTNDVEEEIYLERNGAPLANPVSYQDFVTYQGLTDDKIKTTFIQLNVGMTKMSCTFANEFDGSVSISWKPTYATV